ncbi:MAG: hypothetical protein COV46_00690 [Deltaproteobacteria bacterium CG11_big_fil_rev_8_21_14_0_20_49_13]|nr:MAG: hypothetical protein COV46_00690 [Deltaproteobacteria bacterium CG11_big_fil_rev_8_21_14_0_20_49_13]
MRPELIEDQTFLRYYEKWQKDPTSVVFAAISEIFRSYGMISEAITVAKEGLKHHPDLISGQLALAKAYMASGEAVLAKRYAALVLEKMPTNLEAKKILSSGVTTQVMIVPDRTAEEIEEEITEDMPLSAVAGNTEPKPASHSKADLNKEHGPTDDSLVFNTDVWHTVTMADILKSQGHFQRARMIYKKVLEREPDNNEALSGLRMTEDQF